MILQKTKYNSNYREFNSSITIRVNEKHYKIINKFNRHNRSLFLRQLIKNNLNERFTFIFDVKDYLKIINTFTYEEIEEIKKYNYNRKKIYKMNVRLYEEEKQEIKGRSNNNISDYIETILNNFIINVLEATEGIN